MPAGQGAVEDRQPGEGEPGPKPPEDATDDRVRKIECRYDQADADGAQKREGQACGVPWFPGQQWFQECREDGIARVGQEADGHGGDLNGPEEHRPVGRQHQAAHGEQRQVAPRSDTERDPSQGHDGGQGEAGEGDTAEDDQDGRQRQPLREQPGDAEQKDGQVDLGEATGPRRHGAIISFFLLFSRFVLR
jgi:hypothetical protein